MNCWIVMGTRTTVKRFWRIVTGAGRHNNGPNLDKGSDRHHHEGMRIGTPELTLMP